MQIVPNDVTLAIGDSFITLNKDAITLGHGGSYIVIGSRGILLKTGDEIIGMAKKIQLN